MAIYMPSPSASSMVCSIAISAASDGSCSHRRAAMILSGVMLLVTVWMFYAIPKGFIPSEDNNNLIMFTLAQQGISYESMKQHQLALAAMITKEPAIEDYFASIGPGGPGGASNSGIVFMHLKPRSQRSVSVDRAHQ